MDLFSSLYSFEICSLSSGSSGNCYYIGNADGGILVDVGISAKRIIKSLKEIGKSLESVKAVLITHSHIDHIRSVEAFTRTFRKPVYATAGTWQGIRNNRFTMQALESMHVSIIPDAPFMAGGFSITAFPVSHDANGAVGFHIQNSHKSLAIATDLGIIDDRAAHFLKRANILLLESNYDEEMLENGPYPERLRQRIRSSLGHLSNKQCADFLASSWRDDLSHVFLVHLSEHNNTPEKTMETIHATFAENGTLVAESTSIHPFEREKRSPLFRID